jgi:hypothetical protein
MIGNMYNVGGEYREVTIPTHDKDGLGFYIATLHTVDVCRYKAELGNAATVAVCPLNLNAGT